MHFEKERKLKSLMEKLRLKASQYNSWSENAKSMRNALMDKRQIIDSVERETLQKCLDALQKSIKVTTLQSMVERLESITRQQGLVFTAGPSGTDCFISCDMFYVEVLLENTGIVKDVKIAHQGEPTSCPLLANILQNGDFKEFTNHLEGLISIYQLNADKKQKNKAYLALKALETDLKMLSELQSTINEPNNMIHRSPVGILQERVGGQPMKLTYFISPYDLLDVEAKLSIPLTVEAVKGKELGHSVTVTIESSAAHKLQTTSLMTITKSDGKSLPQFAAVSNLNSTTLPASFALKLPKPTPICVDLLKKIQAVTGISCSNVSKPQPMLSLITQHASDGLLDCNNNKGMFVTLPDQQHCYFMNTGSDLQGVLVSSIPFVHPTHVPQILVFLRQQTLFNQLIGSCIRTCSREDLENAQTFEIIALSWLHISISFEHPSDESMATADLDLSDVTNCKCKLYSLAVDNNICSDEFASKVLQRCLSIPIMMRAIMKRAQTLQKKNMTGTDPFYNAVSAGMNSSSRQRFFGAANGNSDSINGKFSFNGSSDNKGHGKMVNSLDYDCQPMDTSDVFEAQNNTTLNQPYKSSGLLSPSSPTQSLNSASTAPTSESPTDSTFSGSNIGGATVKAEPKGNNMLMNMLHDTAHNQPVTMLLPKVRKQRKRKNDGSVSKSQLGRSPKRKHGADDMREMLIPTPTSTPDHNISSASTSPAGPYDTNTAFFPIKSSPSVDSPSFTNRLTSPLETTIKSEPPGASPLRRSVSVDSGQANEGSKGNEMSQSPDLFGSQAGKDHYEFTVADGAEPNFSGYRSENPVVNCDEAAAPVARSNDKPKEKKVKKIKTESSSADAKLSSSMDIQHLVAEQVAKLHGDSMSPPPTTQQSSTTTGSTSIKISTKDGVKISTKVDSKKGDKRSSSAGVDSESRRKSEARKEKKKKRAESADALEQKASIKLMPLPSGIRVNQSSEKKSGDSSRVSSHGVKPSTPTGGSGSSSQSKMSLTTTIKKSPSNSSSSSSPKNLSVLKQSKSTKSGSKLSSPKSSGSGDGSSSKSLSSKSLKFHSGTKSEKHNSEKLKLKHLSIPSATTITAVSMKSTTPSSPNVTIVQSSMSESSKGSTFSITTPPSLSITPINASQSPQSPNGSSKKSSVSAVWSSSNSNDSAVSKSPSKSRKNSLSAVIDKLMGNASGVPLVGAELAKGDGGDKKTDKKDSAKSVDSRKYNVDSRSSDNKAEFTVKQSSQGIKLTVTKTRTPDGSTKVSKNKATNKSSSWSSSGSPSKMVTKSTSGTSSASNSSKKSTSNSGSSSKQISKSNSSSKVSVSSASTKLSTSAAKSNMKFSDLKAVNSNDMIKQKIEEKMKNKAYESKERKEKNDIESEKAFQMLITQSITSGSYNANSVMSTESASFTSSAVANTISKSTSGKLPEDLKVIPAAVKLPTTNASTELNKSSDLTQPDMNKYSSPTDLSPTKTIDSGLDLSKSMSQTPPQQTPIKLKKKLSHKSDDDDEDELFIDCPDTPKKQKVSFENDTSAEEASMNNNQEPKSRSESKFSTPEPSPLSVKSPMNASTPHSEVLSNPSSVSRPSPCVIDDDLMDEALMLGK